MKIFTDLQNIVQGKTRETAVPARGKAPDLEMPGKRDTIRVTPEMRDAMRAFQNADSMSEALNIAQIASAVIQRAIELSSRLRNIALDAMATSRLNTGAVEEVSAGFRTALQGVPEKYSALVITPQLRPDVTKEAALNVQGSTSGIDIKGELVAFWNTVDAVMQSAPDYVAETGDLLTLLTGKGRELSAYIDDRSVSLNDIAGRFSALMPVNAASQVAKTSDMIVGDHAAAMRAQGNIVNTNVLGT